MSKKLAKVKVRRITRDCFSLLPRKVFNVFKNAVEKYFALSLLQTRYISFVVVVGTKRCNGVLFSKTKFETQEFLF